MLFSLFLSFLDAVLYYHFFLWYYIQHYCVGVSTNANNWGGGGDFLCATGVVFLKLCGWIFFAMFWNRYSICVFFLYIRWMDRCKYEFNDVKVILGWRTWYVWFSIIPWCINGSNGCHFCHFLFLFYDIYRMIAYLKVNIEMLE